MSQSPNQPHAQRFRLPTAVYLSRSPLPNSSGRLYGDGSMTPSGFVPLAIASLAQSLAVLAPAPEGSGQRVLLDRIHQFIGQPTVAMDAELPLQPADVTFALQILLSTLNPAVGARHAVTSTVQCEAVGLSTPDVQAALQRLSGVGVVYPDDWGGDQRQAVAQAILEAKLVDQPSQIYFVDEAIAALLSVVQDSTALILTPESSSLKALCDQSWSGPTLIVVRGGSVLHLAVVPLPSDLHLLQRQQITLRTLAIDEKLKLMVEHLHQALAELLHAASMSPADIKHVLYSDDVEPSTAIAHWLKKQYANATHLWDGDRAANRETSRFAYGAAIQALYTHSTLNA